jgi:hypothetical protein
MFLGSKRAFSPSPAGAQTAHFGLSAQSLLLGVKSSIGFQVFIEGRNRTLMLYVS